MKALTFNFTAIYLMRLFALLAAYPFYAFVGKYLLKNDIYQIKYFTFGSIWFYFIAQTVIAAMWTSLFYFLCILFVGRTNKYIRMFLLCTIISVVEIIAKYNREIFFNKTFFLDDVHSVDFLLYLIFQIFLLPIFGCIYFSIGSRIIKRPTMLP
jgi:hypothetical protein